MAKDKFCNETDSSNRDRIGARNQIREGRHGSRYASFHQVSSLQKTNVNNVVCSADLPEGHSGYVAQHSQLNVKMKQCKKTQCQYVANAREMC